MSCISVCISLYCSNSLFRPNSLHHIYDFFYDIIFFTLDLQYQRYTGVRRLSIKFDT